MFNQVSQRMGWKPFLINPSVSGVEGELNLSRALESQQSMNKSFEFYLESVFAQFSIGSGGTSRSPVFEFMHSGDFVISQIRLDAEYAALTGTVDVCFALGNVENLAHTTGPLPYILCDSRTYVRLRLIGVGTDTLDFWRLTGRFRPLEKSDG